MGMLLQARGVQSPSITLWWDYPTEYVTGEFLLLNSYEISYGTVDGGPYPNVIDLRSANPDDPAVTEWTVYGLSPGTYYGVIKTIDAHGQKSAASSQWTKVVP